MIKHASSLQAFQGSEWWTAFSIEVYNGTITVTEVNKAW